MNIHWGEVIAERLDEVGMTKAEFGRRINTSRQNVNTLLRKKDIPVYLLGSISKVLAVNLFDRLQRETDLALGRKPRLKEKKEAGRDFRVLIELYSHEELNEFLKWQSSQEE